ncbi:hypothetical protein RC86_10870 [Pectobacterium brasiliense]|uniref:hypothetical protein n=1 Tax=Pectobacterium brasiliense TaxID=180957 RepID=UPI00057F70EE|nr:hypothetical protein [Pectobacterium brasiliense]KHS91534.1 hypothetical protein RC86_10870 [Pectobacterium brasiliense]MDY4347622.1 hypothetical protein [Pectobacterium brasiliense]
MNNMTIEEDNVEKVELDKKNVTEISEKISSDITKSHLPGEMSKNFGTGENAKINLILYIISTTLVIFSSIAASLIVINIFGFKTDVIIQYIKDLWAIFTPIITLGLGYLFGANKSEENKNIEK